MSTRFLGICSMFVDFKVTGVKCMFKLDRVNMEEPLIENSRNLSMLSLVFSYYTCS